MRILTYPLTFALMVPCAYSILIARGGLGTRTLLLLTLASGFGFFVIDYPEYHPDWFTFNPDGIILAHGMSLAALAIHWLAYIIPRTAPAATNSIGHSPHVGKHRAKGRRGVVFELHCYFVPALTLTLIYGYDIAEGDTAALHAAYFFAVAAVCRVILLCLTDTEQRLITIAPMGQQQRRLKPNKAKIAKPLTNHPGNGLDSIFGQFLLECRI